MEGNAKRGLTHVSLPVYRSLLSRLKEPSTKSRQSADSEKMECGKRSSENGIVGMATSGMVERATRETVETVIAGRVEVGVKAAMEADDAVISTDDHLAILS